MDAKKETGSQLIRDGNNGRMKFSELEKTRILSEGMRNKHFISEFCMEKGINTDLLVQWKKNILEFDNQEYRVFRNGEAKKEIERLEIENTYLKQLVTNLKLENDKLKKG